MCLRLSERVTVSISSRYWNCFCLVRGVASFRLSPVKPCRESILTVLGCSVFLILRLLVLAMFLKYWLFWFWSWIRFGKILLVLSRWWDHLRLSWLTICDGVVEPRPLGSRQLIVNSSCCLLLFNCCCLNWFSVEWLQGRKTETFWSRRTYGFGSWFSSK